MITYIIRRKLASLRIIWFTSNDNDMITRINGHTDSWTKCQLRIRKQTRDKLFQSFKSFKHPNHWFLQVIRSFLKSFNRVSQLSSLHFVWFDFHQLQLCSFTNDITIWGRSMHNGGRGPDFVICELPLDQCIHWFIQCDYIT